MCVWCTAGTLEVRRLGRRCHSLSSVLEFMQLAMRHGDRFGTNKAYLKLLMPGRNVCHSHAAGLCTRMDRDLVNKFCSILIIINMTMAQILRLYSGEINIFVVFTNNKCTAQSKGKAARYRPAAAQRVPGC